MWSNITTVLVYYSAQMYALSIHITTIYCSQLEKEILREIMILASLETVAVESVKSDVSDRKSKFHESLFKVFVLSTCACLERIEMIYKGHFSGYTVCSNKCQSMISELGPNLMLCTFTVVKYDLICPNNTMGFCTAPELFEKCCHLWELNYLGHSRR